MNGKRWAALGIAAVLFVGSIVINLLSSVAANNFTDFQQNMLFEEKPFTEKIIEKGSDRNKIAVLTVQGVIQDTGPASFFQSGGYNHQQFLEMLELAGKSNDVEGIIIQVNSPGGGVVESAEIHDKITTIQEKHKKPVYISMGSMAASGGYYISAPADKIFAHPSTLTGSLGVIIQSLNYSELAEKFGVKWETIKSGIHKDILSPTREMTEEERNILQSIVDNSYNQFVGVISEGRGIPAEEVREIADGRVYDGTQAKALKLVDELGALDDTIKTMKKDLGNSHLKVIRYEMSIGFDTLLNLTAQKVLNPNSDLLGFQKLFSQTNAPQIKYLYAK
ncbi:signal peptide peptidase SppA [Alkalihalobacillus sp. AL-G]|uniref:signal peptide peptidase SppA n=1 Tax=Alkalihalobacillus sp. AL-G TaxID=2926399 RepID=UPI002729D50D|nr:signal peptide peptidase SppA [Alkalihalobacillus sp. AL-G]WLD92378.1 signal peptide peptidase SppA [Alkalihalobacillus sp. AL-G]